VKENWRRIIADLKLKNITDIIFGGDIGAETGYKLFFETLENFSINLVLGNHDNFNQVSKYFNPHKNENELYYFFEDDHNRFIFLDTSTEKLNDNQLTWLKKNLETEKSLILFIHHPILKVPTKIDELYPLKNRVEIKNMLVKTKKSITIFSGHYHMNDEQIENNVRQIITQSSSYQIEKTTNEISINAFDFGYRIIEIEQNLIKTELVNFKNS